ncbi:MAG: hypothetical protein ACYDAR_09495 [Thermomicrobiales bacterium]
MNIRLGQRIDAQRLSLLLAVQAGLSLVRALLVYAHRGDAAAIFNTLPLTLSYPDRHLPDTMIAVLMTFVCLTMAIRALRHPAAATICLIVIELLLCLSLVDDTALNAQSAYITPPDIQKFVDFVILISAMRLLLHRTESHKKT